LVVITAQEDGKATGRIRLKQVADASAESLEAAVQETVEPGDENKILDKAYDYAYIINNSLKPN
jgi:hypothetical protein